jgi:hypothetical protein
MATETFSNLQPIKGETFSNVTPVSTSNVTPVSTQSGSSQTAQPGFTQRLLESFGLPGTQEQALASSPQNYTDAVKQGIAASTGLLPLIYNYGKTAVRGAIEGNREVQDAATNIAQGGPVGANLG